MLSTSCCRCIYGARTGERFDPQKVLGMDFDTLDEVDDRPSAFPPPQITGLLSYSVEVDQPLRGVPIRKGQLLYHSTEEKIVPVDVTLYVNGLSFLHDGNEDSISLSPFSLVRNCKFESSNLSTFKVFKISLFTHGLCYYFGVHGTDARQAEEDRSYWVQDISRAVRLVTQSLFPPFSISCEPLRKVASTERRLMAGYVIHYGSSLLTDEDGLPLASVLYCELHPHFEGQAKLLFYENELCQTPVMDIYISKQSMCSEKVGINCSCFCVDDHQFSTRTLCERKLWLRAISNVKVKLQNQAPTPSSEDLKYYRQAIKEHISTIKATLEGQAPMDALLQRKLRKSYHAQGGLGGDVGTSFSEQLRVVGCKVPDVVIAKDAAKNANSNSNRLENAQMTDSQPEAPPQEGDAVAVVAGEDSVKNVDGNSNSLENVICHQLTDSQVEAPPQEGDVVAVAVAEDSVKNVNGNSNSLENVSCHQMTDSQVEAPPQDGVEATVAPQMMDVPPEAPLHDGVVVAGCAAKNANRMKKMNSESLENVVYRQMTDSQPEALPQEVVEHSGSILVDDVGSPKLPPVLPMPFSVLVSDLDVANVVDALPHSRVLTPSPEYMVKQSL